MSRVFEHPNYYGGFVCPVCHTSDDRPVVLEPIAEPEGNIVECAQVHADCHAEVEEAKRTINERKAG